VNSRPGKAGDKGETAMMKTLIGAGLCAGLLVATAVPANAEDEEVTGVTEVIKKEEAVAVKPAMETVKPAAPAVKKEEAASAKSETYTGLAGIPGGVPGAENNVPISLAATGVAAKEPTGPEIVALAKAFLDAEVRLQGGFLLCYDESAKKVWQMAVKGVRDPFKDEKGFGAVADAEATGVKRTLELVVRLSPDEKCGGYRVSSYDVRKVDRRAKYELKGTPVK